MAKSFYCYSGDFDVDTAMIGPAIFMRRLRDALYLLGYVEDRHNPDVGICCIHGEPIGKRSILRLDGLYIQNDSTFRNKPIIDAYKKFNKVIFQSFYSRMWYEAVTGISRPCDVIPNGTDRHIFNTYGNTNIEIQKIRDAYRGVGISVSKWREHKRLKEILEFYEAYPNYYGIIIGQPLPILKTPTNVLYKTVNDHKELASLYRSADLMIHPAYSDWCPNVVVEALACGLPLVCSSIGGTIELADPYYTNVFIDNPIEIGKYIDSYPAIDEKKRQNLFSVIEDAFELLPKTPEKDIPAFLNILDTAERYMNA